MMKFRESLLFIIIPACLIALTLFIAFMQKSIIFTPEDPNLEFKAYSDSIISNGLSEHQGEFLNDSVYCFTYTLKQGVDFPFAGFSMEYQSLDKFIDLSDYDFARLRVRSTTSKSVFFLIYIFSEELENMGLDNPLYPVAHEVPTKQGLDEYFIDLKDFSTPLWWYEEQNIIAADVSQPSFEYTVRLNFINNDLLPLEQEDSILFYEVSFHKRKWKSLLLGFIVLSVYFSVILLLKRRKQPVVLYKALDIQTPFKRDYADLSRFISENYHNENLNLTMVSNHLGISASKISTILKKELNLSFPQYLNGIRITEAERLLLETDLQITEVAFSVGYNTITHFNKVFKEKKSLTPLQFRKKRSFLEKIRRI